MRALLDEERLSLTDLRNKTGISLPVVTTIVTNLVEKGFVEEVEDKGQNRGAGRPPSVFN